MGLHKCRWHTRQKRHKHLRRICDELLIPQLKEVADAYDLDGVWVDGDCWAVKPDFSDAAKEAFTKATGIKKIPTKREDEHWLEYLAFQREEFKKYVTKYANALHDHKPGFEVTSNWMYSTLHARSHNCAD